MPLLPHADSDHAQLVCSAHGLVEAAMEVCRQHAAIRLELLEKALLLLWAHLHVWTLPADENAPLCTEAADELNACNGGVPRRLSIAKMRELQMSAKRPVACWGNMCAEGGIADARSPPSLSTTLLELQEYTPQLLGGGALTFEMMHLLSFKVNVALNKDYS